MGTREAWLPWGQTNYWPRCTLDTGGQSHALFAWKYTPLDRMDIYAYMDMDMDMHICTSAFNILKTFQGKERAHFYNEMSANIMPWQLMAAWEVKVSHHFQTQWTLHLSSLFTSFDQCQKLHEKLNICYILNRINVSFQISWCGRMHGSFVGGGHLIVPRTGSQATRLRVE